MRTKVCKICKRRLSLEHNFAFKSRPAGTYRARCKDCFNEKQRAGYKSDPKYLEQNRERQRIRRERNQRIQWDYLKEHPCADCGESDIVVLEFDHIKGEKRAQISHMAMSFSVENLVSEIAKCEVVCANCHKRRTAIRAGWRKLTE